MRKVIFGVAAATLVAGVAGATGAFAGGNGAQQSILSPTTTSDTHQCASSSDTGDNGFVILNAPGQPGAARFVNGEVSLKHATPGTYIVNLADSSGCMMEGFLNTNGVGNGNFHLNGVGLSSGTYYVVLQQTTSSGGLQEVYASKPVTVN